MRCLWRKLKLCKRDEWFLEYVVEGNILDEIEVTVKIPYDHFGMVKNPNNVD